MKKEIKHISIAPMMGYTDRHFRYFLRLLSTHMLLYTEMITTGAILRGNRDYFLSYHPIEHPIALQLGGCDPCDLAECAKIGEAYGYDEINLNVGCPSNKVQDGQFGACLMKTPALVADCIAKMKSVTTIPVTVKCRIGVDDQDSYADLSNFIQQVSQSGCDAFIIHARKAWLQGLSAKENRVKPPLCYEFVHRIKRDFPSLKIILNGGIKSVADIQKQISHIDGVMIGREAYQNPYVLAQIDELFYGSKKAIPSRFEVVNAFLPYIELQLKQGIRLSQIIRYILGLFHGLPGAQNWRRFLSENAHQPDVGIEVIQAAMQDINSGSL